MNGFNQGTTYALVDFDGFVAYINENDKRQQWLPYQILTHGNTIKPIFSDGHGNLTGVKYGSGMIMSTVCLRAEASVFFEPLETVSVESRVTSPKSDSAAVELTDVIEFPGKSRPIEFVYNQRLSCQAVGVAA